MNNLITICAECGAKNRVPAARNYSEGKCGRCGHGLSDSILTGRVLEVSDSAFSQIIEKPKVPVLIDFYSPTCGPCQMLAPILGVVAENFMGKAVIGKINTVSNHIQAAKFQIKGVPALLFFKNGHLVDQSMGAVPQVEIENRLSMLL